jgi:hypothetical protein
LPAIADLLEDGESYRSQRGKSHERAGRIVECLYFRVGDGRHRRSPLSVRHDLYAGHSPQEDDVIGLRITTARQLHGRALGGLYVASLLERRKALDYLLRKFLKIRLGVFSFRNMKPLDAAAIHDRLTIWPVSAEHPQSDEHANVERRPQNVVHHAPPFSIAFA